MNGDQTGAADRAYTISVLERIAEPVLVAASEGRLHRELPRRAWETDESNVHTSPLQAFGRTLSGLAPWLSLGVDESEEGRLRGRYIELAVRGVAHATDPSSPDYMFAGPTDQRLVHAAYLAYPFLIAPEQLFEPLTGVQRDRLIEALKTRRQFRSHENNWVLFSSTTEALLWKLTGSCQKQDLEYAIRRHLEWYLGDGVYGDGPEFRWDYYNSYVIHPLLLETVGAANEMGRLDPGVVAKIHARAARYAVILERLISPEGTYPVLGRSSTYRFAAFKQLGYQAFRFGLPGELEPGATRSALTAVIRRMTEAPGTFDEKGFLTAGVVGSQPSSRDPYNYTGALYMCVMGLTHLGLGASDPFWTAPGGKWFQKRVWDGEDFPNQVGYGEPAVAWD